MKKILGLCAVCILGTSGEVWAANFAVIASPPTMLKFVVLGVAIGCLVGSVKVLSVLKGGLLFKGWQLFVFGFAVLAICQLAGLLSDFEIFSLPEYVAPSLTVVVSALFLYGILQTKRTLD